MSVLTKSAGGLAARSGDPCALFLEFKLAMWVAIGIPVALMGAIAVLPATDINISTLTVWDSSWCSASLSMMPLLSASAFMATNRLGKPRKQAAIDGTWEVSTPVIFWRLDDYRRVFALGVGSGTNGRLLCSPLVGSSFLRCFSASSNPS